MDFPNDLVVKNPPSNAGMGGGSIPGWGTKIPHATSVAKTSEQTKKTSKKEQTAIGEDFRERGKGEM